MKKVITSVFLICFVLPIMAQNCDCEDTFEWLKKTFEENDAGFGYAVEQKGREEYQNHNAKYKQMVKKINNKQECADALLQWLYFFRKGHIYFQYNSNNTTTKKQVEETKEEIRKKFADWEKYDFKANKFQKYVDNLNQDSFEGIWALGSNYTIGIVKKEKEYIGFIMEADGLYWTKGQVKLRIDAKTLKSTFYMRDHSAEPFDTAKLIGKNFLQMGFVTLQRVNPKQEDDKAIERYVELMNVNQPTFMEISDETVLIRIPSFNGNFRKDIEKVLEENHEKITKTKNFIIDIRDNGGGSDGSYSKLMSYLYTNPIRIVGLEFLSTKLNNSRMENFLKEPDLTDDDKKLINAALKKLNANIGKLVNLSDNGEKVTTQLRDTIYQYPENVAILINGNNGSTSEQFLLAAKQSQKVKLFGTTTRGVLDISNMYQVKSPCEDYTLHYSLSKSYRIPDMAIDDKGIMPDYYINSTILPYKWIDFVLDIWNIK